MALSIELSKLKVFSKPKINLEQYPTDPEVAEKLLNFVALNSNIESAQIADLGCGSGILGIGALLLGAKFVYFIDIDNEAINLLYENLRKYNFKNYKVITDDVKAFSNYVEMVDIVVMNPPFGTKVKHSDRMFYDVAFLVAKEVYSITKTSTVEYLLNYGRSKGFQGKVLLRMKHIIKRQFYFHKSKTKFIDISLLYFKKLTE